MVKSEEYSDKSLEKYGSVKNGLISSGDFGLAPKNLEKRYKYLAVLKNILPLLGSDEVKIVLAEVMVALKIEGIIGKSLSDNDSKMVNIIKESILKTPEKKKEAIKFAQKLLE